jgi:hypothetical protein
MSPDLRGPNLAVFRAVNSGASFLALSVVNSVGAYRGEEPHESAFRGEYCTVQFLVSKDTAFRSFSREDGEVQPV